MRFRFLPAATAAAFSLWLALTASAQAVTYTYVGDWAVGAAAAPIWSSNPAVLSGQEAAALLFGGVASDYVISTVDTNSLNINFMAYVDGWGNPQFLTDTVSQSFSLSSNGGGYNNPPSFSAYVYDHSCAVGDPYCDVGGAEQAFNYAFRVETPLPAALPLFATGLGALGLLGWRRKRKTQATA
jgi:hypothetical protein